MRTALSREPSAEGSGLSDSTRGQPERVGPRAPSGARSVGQAELQAGPVRAPETGGTAREGP